MEVRWMVVERATEAELFYLCRMCFQLYGFTNRQPQLSSDVQFQGLIGEMSFLAIFPKFLFACRIEIRFF